MSATWFCPLCGSENAKPNGGVFLSPNDDGSWGEALYCNVCGGGFSSESVDEFWNLDDDRRREMREGIKKSYIEFVDDMWEQSRRS